jgi:hypothetical protein
MGCCYIVVVVRGRKCLLTFAVFGITTHIKEVTHSAHLPALSLLPTSHHPLLAVLFLAGGAFQQQVQVCGVWHTHLPEWRCFLGWVAMQVETWRGPPICQRYGWRFMIQSQEAGLLPPLLKQRKWNNFNSVFLSTVNINRLWVNLKGHGYLFSLILEKQVAVGNSRGHQVYFSELKSVKTVSVLGAQKAFLTY